MKRMWMSFEKGAPFPGEADEQLPRNFYVQGKWHLDGHPMDRGFDAFFGFLAGFADHFTGAPSYRGWTRAFHEIRRGLLGESRRTMAASAADRGGHIWP